MFSIHIGLHKAGTTTIQSFCAANESALAKHNVIYPAHGRRKRPAHFDLGEELAEPPGRRASLQAVADLARSDPTKNYVISSESFHGMPIEKIRALAGELTGLDVNIIAYIRGFDSFIVSQYMQRVKTGLFIRDFDAFFEQRAGQLEASSFVDDIGRWANIFGWNGVRLRTLDPLDLEGGALVPDFLHAVGLDLDRLLDDLALDSLAPRNVSPGWKVIELLHAIHGARRGEGGECEWKSEARLNPIRLRRYAEAAGENLGFNTDRGKYLTQAQHNLSCSLFEAQVRRLKKMGGKMASPAARRDLFLAREFLPEPARLSEAERTAWKTEMAAVVRQRKAAVKTARERERRDSTTPPEDDARRRRRRTVQELLSREKSELRSSKTEIARLRALLTKSIAGSPERNQLGRKIKALLAKSTELRENSKALRGEKSKLRQTVTRSKAASS